MSTLSISSQIEEAQKCGIRVDEDYKQNRNETPFKAANFIIEKVSEYRDIQSLRRDVSPLQGKEMWQHWGYLDKEEHQQKQREEQQCIQSYTEEIKAKKQNCSQQTA